MQPMMDTMVTAMKMVPNMVPEDKAALSLHIATYFAGVAVSALYHLDKSPAGETLDDVAKTVLGYFQTEINRFIASQNKTIN